MHRTLNLLFSILAAMVLLFGAPGTPRADEISIFPVEGKVAALDAGLHPSEYAFHPIDVEAYSESWFFMAHCNDDLLIFGFFGISNIGPGSRKADATVSVCAPGGKTYFARGKVKSGQFQAATDRLDVKAGKNSFRGTYPNFKVVLEEGEIGLDLTYTSELPGWKPNSGKVILDDDPGKSYNFCVTMPRARIEGTVTLQGKETEVTGYGYSDHAYVTVLPHTYAEHWLSLRAFDGEHTVEFLQFTTPEDYGHEKARWLLIGKSGKILLATTDFELTPGDPVDDPEWGYQWPRTIAFKAKQGDLTVEGKVTVEKLVEKLDLLSKLSFFERTIASLVARSRFYRFISDVSVRQTLKGETEEYSLRGVSETLFAK